MKISRPYFVLPGRSRPKCPPGKGVAPALPRAFKWAYRERHPLVPLVAAKTLLDRSSRDVLAMIEDGRLRWAFDIRSPGAARVEIRVLWQSLIEVFCRYHPPTRPDRNAEGEFAAVIDLILPRENPRPTESIAAQEPALTGAELARCFSCQGQHVLKLIHGQALQPLNVRLAPKASPQVTRASVVKFLKERRMS